MKRTRYTQPEKPHELDTLKLLTTPQQFAVITDAMIGEEGDHFIEIIDRIHATWQAMPKTNETDGQGRDALARLHYFIGGCDWWIVERDTAPTTRARCRPSESQTSAWAENSATSAFPSCSRTAPRSTSTSSPSPSATCSPKICRGGL